MITGRHVRAILLAALIAGTLDGLAATVNFLVVGGKDPARVFLFIASGVYGKEAVTANVQLAWWGVLFHYFIALCWTTLYFILYPRLKFLSRNRYLSGVGYAVVIWLVMTLIVLPLSNVPQLPFNVTRIAVGVSILMVFVGPPIAIFAHRFYAGTNTESVQ